MAQLPEPILKIKVDIAQAKIKNPLGWVAGISDPIWHALMNVSIEMMAHRSDLMEDAQREERKTGGIPLFAQHDAAMLLEKYATAITILAVQLMTPDQRGLTDHLDPPPNLPGGDRRSIEVCDHVIRFNAASCEPVCNFAHVVFANGHRCFLFAFTEYVDFVFGKIKIGNLQGCHFADAQPGAIEEDPNGGVALAKPRVVYGFAFDVGVESHCRVEPVHLVTGPVARGQFDWHAFDGYGGVIIKQPFFDRPFDQDAQRCQATVATGWRNGMISILSAEISFDIGGVELLGCEGGVVFALEEFCEMAHVLQIGHDGFLLAVIVV